MNTSFSFVFFLLTVLIGWTDSPWAHPPPVPTEIREDGTNVTYTPALILDFQDNITATLNGGVIEIDVTAGGSGDITSVGDVTTGAAFDGTQGTTLTFNDASGDQTLLYNSGGDLDFNFSDDLNLNDATPHLRLIDTTASHDDFEWYADASQVYLTDFTDGVELLRFDGAYAAYLPNLTNCNTIDTDATGKLVCGTDSGGGGNSFETIDVPAGTDPVADSATDTLTITETTFLTVTGTAATDTLDITQVTTDLGTDGLIAADAVALGTDTTNAYVADLTAGTAIDVSGGGAETANITVNFDSTEVEATTWGAGGNASNIWTFNLSGTDTTMTASSGLMSFSHDIAVLGDNIEATTETDRFVFMANGSTYAPEAIDLGTDTAGAYVTDLTAGTYIDVSGGGGETANVTVTVDATEIEAVTFGAGGNASNLWTVNLSGTDPTLNWVSAGATLVGTFTADGLTLGADENLTIGSDTLTFASGTSDFELSDDLTLTDATPHLRLTDNTASEDDLEIYQDANRTVFTNATDLVDLLSFESDNSVKTTRPVYLSNTVNVGDNTSVGLFTVNGTADQIQSVIQGHSVQTSNSFVIENSAGTDQLTVSNTGNVAITGTVTITGVGNQSTITEGMICNNGSGTDEDDDCIFNTGTAAYEIDAGAGTFTSTANDAGWTIVDGTDNTAGTSMCTSACLFGQDLGGANKPIVSCSDTTADIALCMGAS